jgi:hypothetical protein
MSNGKSQRAAGRLLRVSFADEIEPAGSGATAGEPARVLEFRANTVAEQSRFQEPERNAARNKKISRILGVAIEKLDDGQLDSLLMAVERITHCYESGDS